VAIHPLKHPEPRHSIGIAQPPAFCFVRLFAHAAKRVTFPGQHKYKKAFLHNAFRDRVASSTSTFFHDEPHLQVRRTWTYTGFRLNMSYLLELGLPTMLRSDKV
jgi:hypothetical protein